MTKNNTAYAELMAWQRQTEALAKIAERLGWDQETMMPRGAAEQRGEEMAAMEGVMHAAPIRRSRNGWPMPRRRLPSRRWRK